MSETQPTHEPLVIGRYALFDEIAAGGMASVHLGRLLGPVGFGRTVAIKRLHLHLMNDAEFIAMFLDEARIVPRIRHTNVVPMIDLVKSSEGMFLVMEYVHGESLSKLLKSARQAKMAPPVPIAARIAHDILLGLHAAHETTGPKGEKLDIVHRDVSPQNIIVGTDGVARVLDFGIAKAAGRAQVTREGQIKGKLTYMAPEQIRGMVDRRTDVFAMAVLTWEALTGRRMHEGRKDVEIVTTIVSGKFKPPSAYAPEVPAELDAVILKGLSPDPNKRWATAREMALAIEKATPLASSTDVAEWMAPLCTTAVGAKAALIEKIEGLAEAMVPAETASVQSLVPPQSERQLSAAAGATSTDIAFVSPSAPVPAPRQKPARNASLVIGVAVCAALATLGIVLGGLAFRHRRAPVVAAAASSAMPAPAPPPATSALPSVTSTVPAAASSAPVEIELGDP